MSIRITSVVVAGAFLLIASALGIFVVPKFGHVFADILPGEPLPWPTRMVMSAGPIGFLALAVFGAALLVFTDSLKRARRLHGVVVVTLALALAFTIVALFRPLMRLLEQAT